jgi:hypothetical protein
MSARRLAAAFGLLLVIPARYAAACSCESSGPSCQNYFRVDAVFAGTVTSISEVPDPDAPPLRPDELRIPRSVRVEFALSNAFRGGITGATVSVRTAGSGPACGYTFKVGEQYLVYAYRPKDGSGLAVSLCSRTRPLANAAEDLAFFQTLNVSAGTGGTISGKVEHWERDLATGSGKQYPSVRDVLIVARGQANTFEAVTDEQGRYIINRLPPGAYEVAAYPPAQFAQRSFTTKAELPDPRSCFAADFSVSYDGRIRGRIVGSGNQSVEGAQVELMAVERIGGTGIIETVETSADAGGAFEFIEVGPGRYVVGVDITRRLRSEIVFPTTYHPGTSTAAQATIVEVAGGQHVDLQPMLVPEARRRVRVTGRVMFENGAAAGRALVSLYDGVARFRQVAPSTYTATDGTFAFDAHAGLSYSVNASYDFTKPDVPQMQQVSRRSDVFAVPDDTTITVVLPPPQ